VTPVKASKVVGDCIKVVDCIDSFGLAVHFYEVFYIEAIDWELYRVINFFLLTNLRVSEVEKT
jgi:hypothetical protein